MCTDIIKNSLGNPQPNTEDSFFPNSFLHDIYTSSFMFKSNCDQELRFLRCKWNLNEGNDDLKNEDLFLLWFIAIYLRGPGKTKKSLTNTSWKNKSIFQILYPSTSFRPCLLLLWPWHIIGLITRFFLSMVPLLNLPAIFMTKSLILKLSVLSTYSCGDFG